MQGIRGSIRSGVLAALAASIAAAAIPAAAATAVPDAPPRPVVGVPGGPHAKASQGSYCWERADGSALCADTVDPMTYAPTLRLPAGADPIVRMGYPVKGVVASVNGSDAELTPVGDRKRKFRLDLPEAPAEGKLRVYIYAAYDRGDGSFAIKLVPRGR